MAVDRWVGRNDEHARRCQGVSKTVASIARTAWRRGRRRRALQIHSVPAGRSASRTPITGTFIRATTYVIVGAGSAGRVLGIGSVWLTTGPRLIAAQAKRAGSTSRSAMHGPQLPGRPVGLDAYLDGPAIGAWDGRIYDVRGHRIVAALRGSHNARLIARQPGVF